MVEFEIYFNSVENSCRTYRTTENASEINKTIFNVVAWGFEQDVETAIECASWAELATDGETWENNDITIICNEWEEWA